MFPRYAGIALPLIRLGKDRVGLRLRIGAPGHSLFRQQISRPPLRPRITHEDRIPALPAQ